MTVTEYVSTVAVLIALAALIWQARQATKQARLQTFAAYTQRYQDIVFRLPVAIESDAFDIEGLEDDEKEGVLRSLRAYYDLCSEEHYLNESRLIDKDVWKLWTNGMQDSFQKPAYRSAWSTLQADQYYSPGFAAFVRELRERNRRPI